MADKETQMAFAAQVGWLQVQLRILKDFTGTDIRVNENGFKFIQSLESVIMDLWKSMKICTQADPDLDQLIPVWVDHRMKYFATGITISVLADED